MKLEFSRYKAKGDTILEATIKSPADLYRFMQMVDLSDDTEFNDYLEEIGSRELLVIQYHPNGRDIDVILRVRGSEDIVDKILLWVSDDSLYSSREKIYR